MAARDPDGKPASYVTKTRQNPATPGQRPALAQGWFTVKRQAIVETRAIRSGLFRHHRRRSVGSRRNEGAQWTRIARHLPDTYAVEAAG